MNKKVKPTFAQFLRKFPEIKLPITLTEESHHHFSQKNDPLPAAMISEFILPLESDEVDEFTEYIPCFKIPETTEFQAVVYWKASLLTYEYILVTFTNKGLSINKMTIAGTKSEGDQLHRTVATIEDDWIIYCVRGVATTSTTEPVYDPSLSESLHLELMASGEIVISPSS